MFFKKDGLQTEETEIKLENDENIEIKRRKKISKIYNIIFLIIILLAILVTTDVICVSKFEVGPFFAIPTKTYQDGGTKEYYGLFYKVIKYHQTKGRRDTTLGSWSMPYQVTPTSISTLDLALEIENNTEKTSQKYIKQFLEVTGDIYQIDSKKHTLTLRYLDEDGKYTLDVICTMADNASLLDLSKDKPVSVIGTVSNLKMAKSDKTTLVNTLNMKYCFVK